jgi:Ni/Co efflux regulator RcnB
MKRYAIAAVAALTLVGPLAGTAAAQTRRDVREERQDAREAQRDVRDARRDVREERRDVRQAQRWNQRTHNGYYLGNRFHYGQPSYQHMQRRDYRPAWQNWRRGDRLSQYHRSQYREVDWRRERLRQPPRGYHYVRDDRGEVLLVGIATGVILSILLSQ